MENLGQEQCDFKNKYQANELTAKGLVPPSGLLFRGLLLLILRRFIDTYKCRKATRLAFPFLLRGRVTRLNHVGGETRLDNKHRQLDHAATATSCETLPTLLHAPISCRPGLPVQESLINETCDMPPKPAVRGEYIETVRRLCTTSSKPAGDLCSKRVVGNRQQNQSQSQRPRPTAYHLGREMRDTARRGDPRRPRASCAAQTPYATRRPEVCQP